ncbi:MAG TPA: MarR family transcriptional regulator [Acidimicrobiales bacterium]
MGKALKDTQSTTTLERELGRLRRVHLMQLLRSPSEPGLSPLATELLRVVVESGSIRASDLANTLFVTKTSISRYVNEMLDDGLLVQRRDPTDGRATLLSLSSTGRRALEEREARRTAVLGELCGGWPKGDVATLTTLLRRLNDVSQIRRMEQRVH